LTTPFDPRAKALFLEALEADEPERAHLLARLAQTEPALASQVGELLAAHATATAEGLSWARTTLGRLGAPPSRPGQRLGDYELLAEAGSGAFGSVWRARQTSLDRIVAVKVLRSHRLAGAEALARLRAEAAAVARLDHPHIVPVYEVDEHDGHAWFSMRWVEGGTLADRLGEPWPAHAAAALVADVARAVHHAHQRGLLHRDLKPSNVLLDAHGRPHVTDFGIAKRLDDDGQTTTTRTLAGTPAYMAPEQALGGELTVATDVWGLGCILYELLAGRAAFTGDSVTEVLRRVRHEEPASLRTLRPALARDLETIVLVCLRKEPERRYASADALALDLDRWRSHEPIAARRTGALGRLLLFGRRSPLAATAIGVAASLVLLLAVLATWASVQLGARLRVAYLGQARATRLSGVVGSRATALDLLARAAAIRPGADLRDEAIACLAMTDLELQGEVVPPQTMEARPVADPGLSRVACADAGGLHVLALGDGAEVACLPLPDALAFLRWSRRGDRVATAHHPEGDQHGEARLLVWDVEQRREVFARDGWVPHRAVDFGPNDQLAYGTLEGDVVVLDAGGAETLRFAAGGRPGPLRFAWDGARLAVVVEAPDRLRLFDARSGALAEEVALPAAAFDLCWTGDDRGVAAACADFEVRVFGGTPMGLRAACHGHTAEVVEVFATPGSTLLLSNAWDETARLWDQTTGRELRRMSARGLGLAEGGRRLATADARAFCLWRVVHGAFLRVVHAHRGKSPRDLCFSDDGKRLASAGPDGVFVWEVGSASPPVPALSRHARAVRFLPGGHALLVSGNDGLVRLGAPGTEPEPLLPGPLWSMALSRDGRTLAVQGRDVVHLLDLAVPGMARTLHGGTNLEFLAISADGTRVAAGNWRGRGARLWQRGRGDAPIVFVRERGNVAVALSPDGELLATASSEQVEVWRVADRACVFAVERERAFGNAPPPIGFSPDGTLLAFALSNRAVRLVDARSFTTRGTLESAPPETAFAVAFSPDGAVLGLPCGTNRVLLWHLAELGRELDALGLEARR